MSYDPFSRGPSPVGVRTITLTDGARDGRLLPLEVWYPATDAHRGADLNAATQDTYDVLPGFPPVTQDAVRDAAPRPGTYPLVMFSHGFGGHRRQSTFLCTHLASHGYVVAACDHTGNTLLDVVQFVMMARSGTEIPDTDALLRAMIGARPADVVVAIDQLLDGVASDLRPLIDAERIGMMGHSFGGWTTLVVTARDRRIRAALPLAPAGGASWMPVEALQAGLDFGWGREVPTLYLVADRDTLLPLDGMRELLASTPSQRKRMVVMENTDHMHFCDRAAEVHEMFRMMPPPGAFEEAARRTPPISELAVPEQAYLCIRGLGLAHMDAALKAHEGAAQLFEGDVRGTLAERGVHIAVQ
jgi:predicted dienelactone hydrolase